MRHRFRTLTALMMLTITVSATTAPASGAAGFGDVEEGQWYTDAISWMVSEQITTGTEPGCFSPSSLVTRGQVVTFLHRLEEASNDFVYDQLVTASFHPFVDVTSAYQQRPVGWAYQAGITYGVNESLFAPDMTVTRGEFAVLLWRYAGQPQPLDHHAFEDVHRDYQHDAISWMAENEITTGTSRYTFSPESSMTRAEAATFLFRYVDPSFADTPTSEGVCLAPYREVLVGAGLSEAEAACVTPHLVEFELGYIIELANGRAALDSKLFSLVAEIVSAGCIPTDRYAPLVSALT